MFKTKWDLQDGGFRQNWTGCRIHSLWQQPNSETQRASNTKRTKKRQNIVPYSINLDKTKLENDTELLTTTNSLQNRR